MSEEKKEPEKVLFEKDFDTENRKQKIYFETKHWLETDAEIQEYFEDYSAESVKHFITMYAFQKSRSIAGRKGNEWYLQYVGLQDKDGAEECLGNIQQKKLFNIQCEWRAELFTHPAIETVYDFRYWEANILNCPFLEPITKEDVELYIQYLQEYLGEDLAFLAGWQDYDTYNSSQFTVAKSMNPLKEETDDEHGEGDDDDDEYDDAPDEREHGALLMPPWYRFWDTHRGAGNYLQLPDKKKEKQFYYSRLAAAEEREQLKKENTKPAPTDTREMHGTSKEDIENFMEEFEKDDEALNSFRLFQQVYDNNEENEAMEGVKAAWYDLKDCFESFPIAANADWKQGVITTAQQWKNTKIIRLLPVVYDEYLFRRESGIEHPYDTEKAEHARKYANELKAQILRGRELKGEPKDLNF